MKEIELVRTIEEVSMNAWPALQTVHADGWVLRFGGGYTRRANSVHPLYPSTGALDERIRFCEKMYAGQGLATIFKLTKAALPAGLDSVLGDRGYSTDAHTGVQLMELAGRAFRPDPGVALTEAPTHIWLSAYCRMSGVSDEHRTVLEHILRCILPARRFASISMDGKVVACGMGVLQCGFIGFYDIVTDPAFRRQGHAYRLIESLLAWAIEQGARRAYLQVLLNNPPALALYARLGFKELYQYWYRAMP
jgi:GNAT superfamily N-acetyltransferase